jgi:uncharacterized membrane protein YgcG
MEVVPMMTTKPFNWLVKGGAFALMLVILTLNSVAYAFAPPPAPIPPKSYVADVAHKLSADDLNRLNSRINQVNKTSSNEIAVLIIPSLGDEPISAVAHDTFNAWKVGKAGLDNGVLIVIAVADHKSRIKVGRGIEGDLTDIQSNDILRKNLNPHLKKGDFYGGLLEAVNEISKTVESSKGQKATPVPSAPPPPPPHKDNPRIGATGCSMSTIGFNDNGGLIMFSLLLVAAVVGYVLWRLFRTEDMPRVTGKRYTQYSPPPTPPRRDPEPYRYTPSMRPTSYRSGTVYSPPVVSSYVAPPAPPPAPVSYSSKDEDDYVAPVIAAVAVSTFFDPPARERDSEPSWSPPTPSYEPDPIPSYEPPPSYDPPSYEPEPSSGYSGGESDGGGSESSWDDGGSSDSGSSDSGGSDDY